MHALCTDPVLNQFACFECWYYLTYDLWICPIGLETTLLGVIAQIFIFIFYVKIQLLDFFLMFYLVMSSILDFSWIHCVLIDGNNWFGLSEIDVDLLRPYLIFIMMKWGCLVFVLDLFRRLLYAILFCCLLNVYHNLVIIFYACLIP